jgi:PEGA domain
MKLVNLKVAIVVAGLALAAGPAFAQDPKGGGAGGGSDRGGGGGAAANAGTSNSGGGGNVAGSSGGGSASSSGSFSSPSFGAASSPSIAVSDRGFAMTAPEHRLSYQSNGGARTHTASSGQQASPRSSGSSSGSSNRGSGENRGTATPRGTAASNDGGRPRGSDGDSRARATTPRVESDGTNNATTNREVPTWGRPRGDRPVTGTAVPRTVPPDRSGGAFRGRGYDGYLYDPFGYGFGYGYGYYGSYFSPYYVPYGFGMGYGLSPFGWNPYAFYGDPMDPYDYGAGYGSYSSRIYNSHDQGALKLKVKPRTAKVYVDGYFVGNVDQFDGAFQKLTLNTGSHKVEIKAEGYETAEFDVLITPEQTITFAGDLKKLQ